MVTRQRIATKSISTVTRTGTGVWVEGKSVLPNVALEQGGGGIKMLVEDVQDNRVYDAVRR